jgi:hypothetical protein
MRYIFLALAILFFIPSAYAVTCTIYVDNVTKEITDPVWGVHNSNIFGGQYRADSDCDGNSDSWRNTSWDVLKANQAWTKLTRSDMDLDNQCLDYLSNNFCDWRNSPTTEYQNIGVMENETSYVGNRGGVKIWTLDSPPRRFADNDTACFSANFGDLGQFDFGECGWWNKSHAGAITAQFANDVGCNGTYTCYFASENEPYGKNFLYRNETADGPTRIIVGEKRRNYTVTSWTPWATALKAGCPTCRLISPSFTLNSIYTDSWTDPEIMAKSFMANITAGSAYAPECIDMHIYSSSTTNPKELFDRLEEAQNLVEPYGYKVCGTEGASHMESNFYYLYPTRGIATTTYSFNRALTELNYSFYTPYVWSIAGSSADSYSDTSGCGQTPWYHMVENRNSTPYTNWFYEAYNQTKWIASGTEFVSSYSDDTNVSCAASLNGTGQLHVAVSAIRAATTAVTLNIEGANITGAYVVTNATTLSPSVDSITMPTFAGWGSQVVQMNITMDGGGEPPAESGTRRPIFLNGGIIFNAIGAIFR